MRELPKKGDIKTLYERLMQYVSQYDVEWESRIEGVSEEELQFLLNTQKCHEKVFQYPEDYIIYLRKMGKNDDGLIQNMFWGNVSGNFDFINANLQWLNKEEWYMKKTNMMLFASDEEVGVMYFMYLSAQDKYVIGCEPSADTDEVEQVSSTVEKMLFQSAFKKYERYNYSYIRHLLGTKEDKNVDKLFEKVRNICEKYDLIQCWISDDANFYFRGEKCALWINTFDMIEGDIFSIDESMINDILADIAKITGYRFSFSKIETMSDYMQCL